MDSFYKHRREVLWQSHFRTQACEAGRQKLYPVDCESMKARHGQSSQRLMLCTTICAEHIICLLTGL